MFGIDFRSVHLPRDWERADVYFKRTSKPRGSTWKDNERPLRDNRAHHLRIVKRDDESYDLMLYRHTMLRYHKPEGNTHVVDVFMPWTGRANWNFIWHAGYGWGSKLRAMRHKEAVWLHPYPSSEPECQAAHLVFKRKTRRDEWLLDTTQSWQLQAYRYKYVGTERKEKLAAIAERMRSLVLLLGITQTSYEPEYDKDYTRLFQGRNQRQTPKAQLAEGYLERRAVLANLRQYAAGKVDVLTPEASAGLVAWFQRTLDVRYSKDTSTSATWQMTDDQIEAAVVRLLNTDLDSNYERVKVPVKMWRSGGNRPSRTQSFQTRAEAEKAAAEAKAVDGQ